jgi:hypothetical protein
MDVGLVVGEAVRTAALTGLLAPWSMEHHTRGFSRAGHPDPKSIWTSECFAPKSESIVDGSTIETVIQGKCSQIQSFNTSLLL